MILAADIVCYYTGVRKPVKNMKYVILKDYNDHFKSVKALMKDQEIKLMKFQKDTVALRWFEAAMIFWNVYIGTQNCPLANIVCDESHPDPQRPPLLVDKCYLDEQYSI